MLKSPTHGFSSYRHCQTHFFRKPLCAKNEADVVVPISEIDLLFSR
jgi:hypothetical protein